MPIVIPARVTDELVSWLAGTRLTPVVVLHANHARELDDAVAASVDRLRRAGVMLLNQAVLLARRQRHRRRPVRAQRAARRDRRRALLPASARSRRRGRALRGPDRAGPRDRRRAAPRLPGYAVPQYVQELPGALHKTSSVNDRRVRPAGHRTLAPRAADRAAGAAAVSQCAVEARAARRRGAGRVAGGDVATSLQHASSCTRSSCTAAAIPARTARRSCCSARRRGC